MCGRPHGCLCTPDVSEFTFKADGYSFPSFTVNTPEKDIANIVLVFYD